MADKAGLGSYIVVRLILLIPTVMVLLTLVFTLLRLTPGGPAAAMLGERATPERIALIEQRFGLDRPIYIQYFDYVVGIFQGDLGHSFRFRRPLWPIIKPRLTATMELVIYSFFVAIGLGVFLGQASAKRRGTVWGFLGNLYGIVVYAFPIFWIGMLLILCFGIHLNWFPTSGRFSARVDRPATVTGFLTIDALLEGSIDKFLVALHYLALPALTLGVYISAVFTRMTRTNMLQTLKADYVEAARARGIGDRKVTMKYAFKNALIPIFTAIGLQFALSLAGAVLTEHTFNWPGMANFIVESMHERDYMAVQGVAAVFAIIVAVTSIVIDIVNAFIDTRIRY